MQQHIANPQHHLAYTDSQISLTDLVWIIPKMFWDLLELKHVFVFLKCRAYVVKWDVTSVQSPAHACITTRVESFRRLFESTILWLENL